MGNVVRRVVTVMATVALLVPLALDRDSHPLSTYPMYARSRSETVSFTTAVGVDTRGERQRLSLAVIGDGDDPLIVASGMRQTVGLGPTATSALCGRIALRAAAATPPPASIEIVTERHDVVAHVKDEPSLLEATVHATCPVDSDT